MDSDSVSLKAYADFAEIVINNPPVHALSHTVRIALLEALQDAQKLTVKSIILTGAGNRFVAGADINELDHPIAVPGLLEIEKEIARLSVPVVAAIEGRALGGGFLLALMCDVRVADSRARLGFPEVQLGLLPTFGGTQIVPKACDPAYAASLVAGGGEISAGEALSHGLVDAVTDVRRPEDVAAFAAKRAKRRLLTAPQPAAHARTEVARALAESELNAPDFLAPKLTLEAMLDGFDLPLEEALRREAQKFEALRSSSQSRTLRALFFEERASRRPRQNAPVLGVLSAPGLMSARGLVAFCPSNDGRVTYEDALAQARQSGRELVCVSMAHEAEAMVEAIRACLRSIAWEPNELASALCTLGFDAQSALYWCGVSGQADPARREQAMLLDNRMRAALRCEPPPAPASAASLNLLAVWALGWPRWRADIF